VRIQRLRLTNFKGIKDLALDLAGQDASIYGANATGKTTIYDAFLWLLFDKDSANRSNFAIKTLQADGEALHGLDHEVEAVLSIGGAELTLKKSFKEKWTKRRGSAKAEFTGHTTDYFLDGVPAKKAEYDAKIAEIADEDVFKLLTSPSYFNEQMRWQDRRELLLEVCGDISDADVIASNRGLAKLPGILGKRSLEDHRKVIQARRTEINRELQRIPVRIDEVMKGLPDVGGLDEADLRNRLAELRAQRQNAQVEQVRISSGGEIAEQTKRLREIEAELIAVQSRLRTAAEDLLAEDMATLRQANADTDAKEREVSRAKAALAESVGEAERVAARMDALRQQWYETNKTECDHTEDAVCPTCGQAIPEDQLQKARDRALAAFNLRKAEQLESLSAEGRRLKERFGDLQDQQKVRRTEIADAEAVLVTLNGIATTAQERIDKLSATAPDLAKDSEYRKLMAEKASVEKTIASLRQDNTAALEGADGKLAAIGGQIRDTEAALSSLEHHRRGQQRIEELKAEERQLAAEYEQLEQELYLTEQFVRAKVALLEDRINSRFELARFKLFEQQINGALNEVCETTHHGVPYSAGLNNAACINVGLDIIRTLSEHYRFTPPVFVDNAEAVVELLPLDAQVIRLVVSGEDKALRVEIASGATKEVALHV
jgi:chromosome segregation ATPase